MLKCHGIHAMCVYVCVRTYVHTYVVLLCTTDGLPSDIHGPSDTDHSRSLTLCLRHNLMAEQDTLEEKGKLEFET